MYKRETVVKNPTGLHARPATEFCDAACEFEAEIEIARAGEEDEAVDAKSTIMLLTLGMMQGEKVIISADGDDEKQAVDTLIELIDSGFGEV